MFCFSILICMLINSLHLSLLETDFFFRTLQMEGVGTNFRLAAMLFRYRDRDSVKNKFVHEEKKNPAKITEHLKNRIPYDATLFPVDAGRFVFLFLSFYSFLIIYTFLNRNGIQ